MNGVVKKILLSIGITVLISAALGFALAPLLGGWLNAFVFSFILQVIGNYFYNDFKIRKQTLEDEALLNERLEILSRNQVNFECPCGDNTFEEIIYPGEENVFKCEKCNQNIRVDITFTPVVITSMLTLDPLQKIQNIVEQ